MFTCFIVILISLCFFGDALEYIIVINHYVILLLILIGEILTVIRIFHNINIDNIIPAFDLNKQVAKKRNAKQKKVIFKKMNNERNLKDVETSNEDY